MLRIVVGSYLVRYPLGGMMSWTLQYLIGLRQLGHEVFFVEKANYPDACFDPRSNQMGDDASYGVRVVSDLLDRFGLSNRLCFVDYFGQYHGIARNRIEEIFDTADVFIDMGAHGAWLDEAARTNVRVLIDGEPGYTQMRMELRKGSGEELQEYDAYFTNGLNIGTPLSSAPTAGKRWQHIPNPVAPDVYAQHPAQSDAPFTTVMNWQSHAALEYRGVTYGQKDVEFAKFVDLPPRTDARLEVAVAGTNVPRDRLSRAGWGIQDAHVVTTSFDSYVDYIRGSLGELGICKNVFVATNSGWTSDRSAAYLATGRPVVMQDTGFGTHIPCGLGLVAVRNVEDAANAINEIIGDYQRHATAAREIAVEYFDAQKVMGTFLDQL